MLQQQRRHMSKSRSYICKIHSGDGKHERKKYPNFLFDGSSISENFIKFSPLVDLHKVSCSVANIIFSLIPCSMNKGKKDLSAQIVFAVLLLSLH